MLEATRTAVPATDEALPATDEALVRRARAGDASACEELFVRHRSDSYRVAYRHLGHEQDSLDVVQEAMLKAFSALHDFDGRGGFRTWLLKIVTNTALDWGRRRQRRSTRFVASGGVDDWLGPTVEPDPGRRIDQQELRGALDHALSGLSPTIRTTFVLFAEAGMTYKEIALAQNIAIGTVMSRIHSAREKLQKALDWDRLHGLGEEE